MEFVMDKKPVDDFADDLFLDEPLTMSKKDLKEAEKLAKQEERWKKREERQAKKDQKEQEKWEKKQKDLSMDTTDKTAVSSWFITLCLTNIPVINVIYLLCMAIYPKNPQPKRSFAIAYLLYRLLVWILAITVLYVLLVLGTDFIDGILSFLEDYHLF